MKKINKGETGGTPVPPSAEKAVRERLGAARLKALGGQATCLANGGIDAVVQAACREVAGWPQPVVSGACRVIQLCGSVPTAEDAGVPGEK